MTPSEERRRYLLQAERCRRQAERVPWPDIREQLKQIAREYEQLAGVPTRPPRGATGGD